MNEDKVIRYRMPEELQKAVMAGTGYLDTKYELKTLEDFKKIYEEELIKNKQQVARFNGLSGIITERITGDLEFKINDTVITVASRSKLSLDKEALDAVLDMISAVFERPVLENMIAAISNRMMVIEQELSTEGIASLANDIREDVAKAMMVVNDMKTTGGTA